MNVISYTAEHLHQVDLQGAQAYLSDWVTPDMAAALENETWSFTAMQDNGVPLGCAGVLNMWQGRGIAWAYLSKYAAEEKFLQVHRAVLRFLDAFYLQRIEMTVDCEFEQGHRWAKMLGFTMEAERMRAYRPDGGDVALYARVL
jgi:ribosomal protein S18 acetylase RimI-like enzyme